MYNNAWLLHRDQHLLKNEGEKYNRNAVDLQAIELLMDVVTSEKNSNI
jgi:hypothetical protein